MIFCVCAVLFSIMGSLCPTSALPVTRITGESMLRAMGVFEASASDPPVPRETSMSRDDASLEVKLLEPFGLKVCDPWLKATLRAESFTGLQEGRSDKEPVPCSRKCYEAFLSIGKRGLPIVSGNDRNRIVYFMSRCALALPPALPPALETHAADTEAPVVLNTLKPHDAFLEYLGRDGAQACEPWVDASLKMEAVPPLQQEPTPCPGACYMAFLDASPNVPAHLQPEFQQFSNRCGAMVVRDLDGRILVNMPSKPWVEEYHFKPELPFQLGENGM